MTKPLTTRQAFNKLIKLENWHERLKDGKGEKSNRAKSIIRRGKANELTDGFLSDLLRECKCKQTVKEGWEL